MQITVANHSVLSKIRTLVRKCREAIARGEATEARQALGEASTAMAKAASKGILHHRNAARRTSRLAKRLAALER